MGGDHSEAVRLIIDAVESSSRQVDDSFVCLTSIAGSRSCVLRVRLVGLHKLTPSIASSKSAILL